MPQFIYVDQNKFPYIARRNHCIYFTITQNDTDTQGFGCRTVYPSARTALALAMVALISGTFTPLPCAHIILGLSQWLLT